ncbi:sodium/proton antiporter, CPA1 family [Loktanella atrilutea]|uniref:Sodium/proton antiporter, CPA1 family n=1 Tax=Loktanella atrilutea TaxID=366533 RepID=A0A1M4UYX9_LOKAT|nr:sodium:proton antiporter [Loktanella atrilutea]SHE61882.1 sodium/proton antiporter, CPA1 family [Loktanella atrilutea]
MAIETAPGALSPVIAIALVGGLGVGSQWLAWRLRMPAIVLMLVAGIVIGPVLGVFDPARDIGPLMEPIIAIAVAIILFEGGLTLNFHQLRDAAVGVRRLVFVGAPLGWLLSALTLHFGAGLSWSSSWVFGGILIVTGPTVIAPLLRTARLSKRPAKLLQWEAIVNDPLGAMAAVLAFEVVLVLNRAETMGSALLDLVVGIAVSIAMGLAAGYGLAAAFRRGYVPEYMKVSILFALLLGIFGISDAVLHESGLLAVTVMGIVIANANLPSYEELRRFKEHATILLVSGVFILLAANLDFAALELLTWRAAIFLVLIICVARPLTVFASLLGSGVPWREQLLIAFTGPRGVVLVAVAGLFAERLLDLGFEDAALIGPLAFVLVAATVVLHGFTLKPFARFLGLAGADNPGVVIIGGSSWTTALAEALVKAEVPVLMTDPNFGHLRAARSAGIATYSGDILSEGAEQRLELVSYATLLAATDNDAYNTLVATDLAPEFGRENVFQIARTKTDSARHMLPATLGGRPFGHGATFDEMTRHIAEGWTFRVTRLTEEFGLKEWSEKRPASHLMARISPAGEFKMVNDIAEMRGLPDTRIIALRPPEVEGGVTLPQPPAST